MTLLTSGSVLSSLNVRSVIMIGLTIRMYLFFCLVVNIAIWQVDGEEGFDIASCSCYSFHDQGTSRDVGKTHCKHRGGNLVSMETVEEWEFIKTQIQNRTTELLASNNWWIGLEKKDNKWKWQSNHTLKYDKWLRGKPEDNEGMKFVAIVKEFNGTQGLFNTARDGDHKGRICEYHKTNCSGENELRWCRSTTPDPVLPRNATKGLNESILPRYPSGCKVIKKQETPVTIPIMVALAGLVVIVAINIIIIKCKRNTVKESSNKRDKLSHSEQEDIDHPADGIVIAMTDVLGSGIKEEENVQPREDCIGKSATNSDDGTHDIIDIDFKPEQPYYVNVQGSSQHTDNNGHYASVGEITETDQQKDSFVMVTTYSIVQRNDDDGQTDDVNTSNYATVSDTLGTTDRQSVTLKATESGYASVDVINNNSQKVPSISGHDNEHDTPINVAHDDGSVQYAIIDIQKKKNSKKDKTRQPDNQNNTDDGQAPPEVIYDNCQDVSPVQEGNTQHSLANTAPNTGANAEYAVVNKSMKKRNKSVKDTAQSSKPTETSNASVDVEHCQDDSVANTGANAEYAVVNKSMKKRNKSVKDTAQPSKPTETSNASVDVEHCQDNAPEPAQRRSRRNKQNNEKHTQADSVSSTGAKVEYAAVDKSKKRNRSAKEAAKPIKPTENSHASVNVECCQDDSVPNAETQEECAAVDKSKKRNKSAKQAATPIKPIEASYASVDVKCCQESAPVPAKRRSLRKKNTQQHTQDDSEPSAGVKIDHAVMDKSKEKNRSVKEVIKPSEATEASYASVDVIYGNC